MEANTAAPRTPSVLSLLGALLILLIGVVLSGISKASLPPQEGTQFPQQLSFEAE